jgi:hypothetical protein
MRDEAALRRQQQEESNTAPGRGRAGVPGGGLPADVAQRSAPSSSVQTIQGRTYRRRPKGRLYCIDSKLRLPYYIEGFVFPFSGTREYGRAVLLSGDSYRAGVVNAVMSSTVP